LVVVSDKKIPICATSVVLSYTADVVTANDYSPFGAPLAGRSYTAPNSDYRYGFNGQEKVDEISGSGNHNTALFWEYDTRLGRRWNTDPVVKPWESSYACLYNNPIRVIDPYGDDGYVDEKGNHLGDDGNKESHQTRVMSADAWKKTIGDNKTVTDEMRKSLTGGSTLLTDYKQGVRISDDTWGKLTAAGGERLNPWLVNNSSHNVFAKSEDGAEVFDISSGTDLYYTSKEKASGIDGFAAPHLRKNEVVKVSNGTRVTIDDDDYATTGGSFFGSVVNLFEGGWKNESWLKQTSANKITTLHVHIFTGWVMNKDVKLQDKQWISIFLKSGLINASEYYKYYEITEKKWLID